MTTFTPSCDETKTVFGLPCRCIVKGEHYVHDWDAVPVVTTPQRKAHSMKTVINGKHSLTLVSGKVLHIVRVDFDRDYLAADVFRYRIGGFDVSNTRVLFHPVCVDGAAKGFWKATGPLLDYKAGLLFCQATLYPEYCDAPFADQFDAAHRLFCPDAITPERHIR